MIRDWTVLVFANGNCNRDLRLMGAVRALGGIGTDDRVAFAAQLSSESEGGCAERLTFGQPSYEHDFNVQVEEKLGPANMGEAETLTRFLEWGARKYPAQHYLVVLAGHGGGFRGCLPDTVHQDHLTNAEVATSVEALARQIGRPVDMVVHDSCFMGCLEAAAPLASSARYVVASQEYAYGDNLSTYQLADDLTRRCARGPLPAEEAVGVVMGSFRRPTAESAVRCEGLNELVGSVRNLSAALLESADVEGIRRCFEAAPAFGRDKDLGTHTGMYRQTRDVAGLAAALATGCTDERVREAAREVGEGARAAVAAVRLGPGFEDARGLSLYAPVAGAAGYLEDYAGLDFSRDTGWGEVVRRFGVR